MFHALAMVGLLATGSSNICDTQSCVVYAETATALYQIDPVSLTQTKLCNFSIAAVNDIAVDANGTLYGLTSSELYRVNPSNCAATAIASVSNLGSNFNGLSFLLDGRLIAVDDQGTVAQINTSNGSVTQIGSYGGSLGSSGDVVALSNGQIFATARDNSGGTTDDILVSLDPGTFAATRIGTISGYSGIYGVGYWAGVLYGFDAAGHVLKIDPGTGAATVAISNSGLQWYGAGTTPLAPTTCQDACSSGQTACDNSGNLLTCQKQASGCYDWRPSSCGSNQTCSDGACVATCSSTCVPFTGGCQDGTHVESCDYQSDGCFHWDVSACPANQVCSSGDCVPSCSNQCAQGQVTCNGSTIQSCGLGADGCWAWQDGETCAGEEICSNGQCVTTCSDACTLGAQACSGAIAQSCVTGASGCTEWQNGADCSATGCEDGVCCACTLGQTQCGDDGSVQVCEASQTSGSACPSWVSEPCTSGACENGYCLTACNPTSELSECSAGAQCVAIEGGNYCGLADADGGYVGAPPSAGSTSAATSAGNGGTTGSDNGGNGATTGGDNGAGGIGGTSGHGSTGGGDIAGSGDTSGQTLAGDGASSGSAGGASTTAGARGATDVTSAGCGCGSAEASSSIFALVGLLGLAARRRR